MSLPPEAWGPARSFALRLVRPVERFLHIQAASGVGPRAEISTEA
ncbi:MAG TPA: hypothetical protein VE093_04200 [Polyangiaceae bacterium]|nr:hypothetical protein [Polyangiaceae bacterium]